MFLDVYATLLWAVTLVVGEILGRYAIVFNILKLLLDHVNLACDIIVISWGLNIIRHFNVTRIIAQVIELLFNSFHELLLMISLEQVLNAILSFV